MTDAAYHLAQFNIARLRAPLDTAEMAEFVAFLDPINAFAERCPGFVWRLTAPDGASSSYLSAADDDPMVIPNLSVWTDIASLRTFAYQTVHRYFLQNRRTWFERMEGRLLVLWWVPAGCAPVLDEAKARLRLLEERGPTAAAFTFQDAYDPTGTPLPRTARPAADD